MKDTVVAILLAKALPPDRGPGRDECSRMWVIKMGHVLVGSILEILIVVGRLT